MTDGASTVRKYPIDGQPLNARNVIEELVKRVGWLETRVELLETEFDRRTARLGELERVAGIDS